MLRALLFWTVLAGPAAAATAIDAGAPKGAEQTAFAERGFDTYDLPIAPFGGTDDATRRIEGRTRWTAFRVDAEAAGGTGAVIAGYRSRLADQGFAPVLDCAGIACGGFDFRFGATLLPPPGMQMDVQDFAQLTMQRTDGSGYVSVLASRVRDRIFVQTVSVAPTEGGTTLERAPTTPTAADTVEPSRDTSDMLGRLLGAGRVTVSGLDFATGGAQLSATSGPALDRVAQLLADNPDVSVAIVGHSDNQGGLDP
ncbi:MAG: hypothetical protein AAGB15_01300, partial [Pseudomonadota bacterium]